MLGVHGSMSELFLRLLPDPFPLNPRVALLSSLAWDPNYRIANAASVEIVFGDMLPRTESTAPRRMGLGNMPPAPLFGEKA